MNKKKTIELWAARDTCGEIGLFTKKPKWIDEDDLNCYVSNDKGGCYGCVTNDLIDISPGQRVKVRIEIEILDASEDI